MTDQTNTPQLSESRLKAERAFAEKGFSWDHWKFVTPETVRCAVCGADDADPLLDAPLAPGQVVKCRRCGMVYVSPVDIRGLNYSEDDLAYMEHLRTSSDLSELDKGWEHAFLQARLDERPALRRNYEAILTRIARYTGSADGRLLDFGAGWGFFLAEARDAGWDTTGVEPLPGHALYAREELGLDVRPDVLRPDTFPSESFDVVTSLQVFEHLDDPAGELAKIVGVLKPGGLLVLEVPSIDTPLLRLARGKHRHFVPDHYWFFSPDTLQRFVARHDLETIELYHPTRRLSVRWLVNVIGKRYMSEGMTRRLSAASERLRVADLEVALNFRDVALIMARKPLG